MDCPLAYNKTVQISYTARDATAATTRMIRPLHLEQHGPHWYLHAYCTGAQAERCFRLDRIGWLLPLMQRRPRGKRRPVAEVAVLPLTPPPRGAREPAQASGGFAPPPPRVNHPLVRVWLE